jgi:hypothetical protein
MVLGLMGTPCDEGLQCKHLMTNFRTDRILGEEKKVI